MARYTVGVNSTVATTGTGRIQLRSASSDRVYIREVTISIGATTASAYGLYRSATLGTASTTVTPEKHDTADGAASCIIETAWSAAPTVGSVALRRMSLPATIGAGVIWQFYDEPLVIPVSSGVILWSLSTTANTQDIYVVFDE